ncbi:spore germination protein [Aquibacillus sp. 3ASR75-11]|uniref:Spore germination protein n=1 Tax=Terrihalobacillus insolitus TaxID=2950438 RepID=A0A9X3WTU4_9BACI|nr:spore germination protein [Terrihalobacillus insolitus]MDC3413726.1 spore germination protein [Terrihalobacillus insolitus]MDC3425585.1 spore germination protein [Terrihalobacillus insolitus]
MPAVVGAVKVLTLSTSSIFNIGDVYAMHPYSQAKTFAGGGSFNTGDDIQIQLDKSSIQVSDKDTIDQVIE